MTNHLEPDVYQRTRSLSPIGGGRRRQHDVAVFGALIGLSLVCVALDRFEFFVTTALRSALQDAATPVLGIATGAAAPVLNAARMLAEWETVADDRNRLREENERLKSWEARARALERQSAALIDLARVVEEPKLSFVTARIVSGSGGPFVRAAMLDAGRGNGIKPGYPAMSAQGLVGRVIAAGSRSSRLLLLTDFNSRIPVVIGADAARAVMQGDNGPLPKISYLQPGNQIKPGDDVFTSGVGGLFPRGLRIGTVVDTGETIRIEPAAQLDKLEYVSVLFFETLAATLADEERAAEGRAGLSKRLGPSWPTSAEGGLAR